MKPSDLDRSLSIPDAVMIRELEGESVILNLETEHYFGLDEVGTHMLQVLVEAATLREGARILEGEYDTDGETLNEDLMAFVSELVDNGLVVLGDGPDS